jgi:hypothetical protein
MIGRSRHGRLSARALLDISDPGQLEGCAGRALRPLRNRNTGHTLPNDAGELKPIRIGGAPGSPVARMVPIGDRERR